MSRLNIILLIVFVTALITITLSSPQTVARIQNGAMTVFSPFMRASNQLESGVETVGTESLSPAQLREVVDELERERNRLKLEVIQLDEIVRENNQLRRALQYVEKAPLSVVAARVISRKPSTWYNTMIIDKGKAHGIEVDNPVIVPVGEDAGLVGKVSEVVGDNSAIILLLTDENVPGLSQTAKQPGTGHLERSTWSAPNHAKPAATLPLPRSGSRTRAQSSELWSRWSLPTRSCSRRGVQCGDWGNRCRSDSETGA